MNEKKYLQTAKENRFGGQGNIDKKCKKTIKNNEKKLFRQRRHCGQ